MARDWKVKTWRTDKGPCIIWFRYRNARAVLHPVGHPDGWVQILKKPLVAEKRKVCIFHSNRAVCRPQGRAMAMVDEVESDLR